MLYDKRTKALFFEGEEKIRYVLNTDQMNKLSRFLNVYFHKLKQYTSDYEELNELFYMHFGSSNQKEVFDGLYDIKLRDLYLMIEIFAKVQFNKYKRYQYDSFLLFVQDINNFFMIERVPLQLIYVRENEDIFMEKVIDDIHSEKVKEVLSQFGKYKKVHEDFKLAIISYSSGDNQKSIEKSCIAIEDYLCVILEKDSCNSVDSYYKDVAKKLNIPDDINDRFKSMISFIHNYRSKPLHGSKKEHDPENPHLIAQIVIGFSMVILNYLYCVFEKTP